MHIKTKGFSLLLLTLILNVHFCSSAPIPATVVQFSDVAEEPGPDDKDSVQDKIIPVVAEEAALPPEEVTVKEPEPVLIKDLVSADADEAVSQELDIQEPLAVAPEESVVEESALVEPAFAEASPEEKEEVISAVENESLDQHGVEDSAQETPILVSPVKSSEDEAPEENIKEQTTVIEEGAVENVSPEQHDLQDPDPAAPITIIPIGTSEDGASEEIEEEAALEETLLIVPDDHAAAEPAQELLSSAPEKDTPVVLVPAEPDTVQEELSVEDTESVESAPEKPAVAPKESAEEDPEEIGKTIPIIVSETTEEEATQERAKEEEAVVPIVLEENAKEDPVINEEPEESVVLSPMEPETKEDDQVEPAAEEKAPQESSPEYPIVIVPLDSSEGESEKKEGGIEDAITIVSLAAPRDDDVIVANEVVPHQTVPEKNDKEEPGTNEENLPNTSEEETIVLVPAELEAEEEDQDETGEPVYVPLEPTSEEPTPEDPILVIYLEDSEENLSSTLEEETPAVLVPEDQEETGEPVYVLVEPTSEEPAEDPILIISQEDSEENVPENNIGEEEIVLSGPLPEDLALVENIPSEKTETEDSNAEILVRTLPETTTETLNEIPIKQVTAPAPIVTDAEPKKNPVLVEDVLVDITAHKEDFQAAAILTEVKPINRGAVLGVAFFTLMCFITIGFVWIKISRKLRTLK